MEKASSSRSLEVTVISAEDLRLNGGSLKKNAFVIVRTDSLNQGSTSIDSEGGNCPSWNQKLKPLSLPNSAHFITVEVQCKTSSGVKTVGTAMISVSEFTGDCTPPQYLHFLSYRLRDRKGERNGIINLSVKLVGAPTQNYFSPAAPPHLGVAAAYENHGKNSCSSGSGTALGVPVPIAYGYGYGYGA